MQRASEHAIVATMATVPGREGALADTIRSLASQVDMIAVYANFPHGNSPEDAVGPLENFADGPEDAAVALVHSWETEEGDLTDQGKFFFHSGRNHDGDTPHIHLVCDDDLIYPHDYADKMVHWIEHYRKRAVVGYHGVTLMPRPIASYYSNRRVMHGLGGRVDTPTPVHLVATSSCAYWTGLFGREPLTLAEFGQGRMADIWFGIACQRRRIPAVCIPHHPGEIRHSDKFPISETIYAQERHRDGPQTRAVNAFQWEILDPSKYFRAVL